MNFLLVVLGAPEATDNINYRDADCQVLFDYGFTNYDKIIATNKQIDNFLNNFFINGLKLNIFFKIILVVFLLFFFYVILNKTSYKDLKKFSFYKFKDKITKITKLKDFNKIKNDEIQFRGSFW